MSDRHHEPLQSVEMVDVGITRFLGEAQVGAAREEDWQRDLKLESGEWCANAEVQAGAKRNVGLDRA